MKQNPDLSLVEQMKQASFESSLEYSLPVGNGTYLVPVGPWIFSKDDLVEAMSEWRSAGMMSFFKRFQAAPESTRTYLSRFSIGQKDRILFLIRQNEAFNGHLGLASIGGNSLEIDNVIKSPDWSTVSTSPTMTDCLRVLIEWSRSHLGTSHFSLNVLSSNNRALAMYEKLGFRISVKTPVVPDQNCIWGSLIDSVEADGLENTLYRLTMKLDFTDGPGAGKSL